MEESLTGRELGARSRKGQASVQPLPTLSTNGVQGDSYPAASVISKNRLSHLIDLVWHLAQREFILRYKGSAMGILWILVSPLLQLLMLVFVFNKVLPLNIDSYPAFVFTGLLPWTWFSSCVGSAGNLFVTNRDLIRRPNFPPLTLIAVNIASNLLIYLVVLPLVLGMLYYYGHKLTWAVCLLPLLILIQSLLIGGIISMIATWNVFYRDVQQLAGIIVMLLFWITPVFYRAHSAADKYQFLFDINPIAVLITAHRAVLFYGAAPEWNKLLGATITSIVLAFLGYFVYSRQLHNMVDAL